MSSFCKYYGHPPSSPPSPSTGSAGHVSTLLKLVPLTVILNRRTLLLGHLVMKPACKNVSWGFRGRWVEMVESTQFISIYLKVHLKPTISWIFSPCQKKKPGLCHSVFIKNVMIILWFSLSFSITNRSSWVLSFQEENEVQQFTIIPMYTWRTWDSAMVSYLKEYDTSAPKFKYLSRHTGNQ